MQSQERAFDYKLRDHLARSDSGLEYTKNIKCWMFRSLVRASLSLNWAFQTNWQCKLKILRFEKMKLSQPLPVIAPSGQCPSLPLSLSLSLPLFSGPRIQVVFIYIFFFKNER